MTTLRLLTLEDDEEHTPPERPSLDVDPARSRWRLALLERRRRLRGERAEPLETEATGDPLPPDGAA